MGNNGSMRSPEACLDTPPGYMRGQKRFIGAAWAMNRPLLPPAPGRVPYKCVRFVHPGAARPARRQRAWRIPPSRSGATGSRATASGVSGSGVSGSRATGSGATGAGSPGAGPPGARLPGPLAAGAHMVECREGQAGRAPGGAAAQPARGAPAAPESGPPGGGAGRAPLPQGTQKRPLSAEATGAQPTASPGAHPGCAAGAGRQDLTQSCFRMRYSPGSCLNPIFQLIASMPALSEWLPVPTRR